VSLKREDVMAVYENLVRSTLRTLGIDFRTPSQAIFMRSELDSGRSELIFESGLFEVVCTESIKSQSVYYAADNEIKVNKCNSPLKIRSIFASIVQVNDVYFRSSNSLIRDNGWISKTNG
jgi:hypothetical protein